jgi:hypothetical protein
MPRTDQATRPVDRSVGEIGTEMATTASHCKQFTVGVSHGVPSGAADDPGTISAAAATSVSRAIAPPTTHLDHRGQPRLPARAVVIEPAGAMPRPSGASTPVRHDRFIADRRLGVVTSLIASMRSGGPARGR